MPPDPITPEAIAAARLRLVLDAKLHRETPARVREIAAMSEIPPPAPVTPAAELTRDKFDKAADTVLATARHPLSVLTVALDDSYAPVSMAAVVRVLGDLVRGVVGETGLVGRSGRGKFVAMASGGAEGLAKRLHEAVRAQSWDVLVGEGQVPRVSIGAADTRRGERVDGVMLRADGALADARKRGGDQVVTASTEQNRPFG